MTDHTANPPPKPYIDGTVSAFDCRRHFFAHGLAYDFSSHAGSHIEVIEARRIEPEIILQMRPAHEDKISPRNARRLARKVRVRKAWRS